MKVLEDTKKLRYNKSAEGKDVYYSAIWYQVCSQMEEVYNPLSTEKEYDEVEVIRLIIGVEHLMCDYPENYTHLEIVIDEVGFISDVNVIDAREVIKGKRFTLIEEENDYIISQIPSLPKREEKLTSLLSANEIITLLALAKVAWMEKLNDPTFEWC